MLVAFHCRNVSCRLSCWRLEVDELSYARFHKTLFVVVDVFDTPEYLYYQVLEYCTVVRDREYSDVCEEQTHQEARGPKVDKK